MTFQYDISNSNMADFTHPYAPFKRRKWQDIVEKPNEATVPTNPAALCILAFGAVQRVEKDTIGKWFDYMKRTPKELQSVFCLTASKNEDKKRILFSSQAFVEWARANQYLF
jgi:hypothetical protein